MPVAANDFSRGYYSYDEVAGDFELTHFSIANDEETLIPFIQAAQRVNPDLKIWASPWCPPQWMKDNGHYACRTSKAWVESSLSTQKRGAANVNMPVPPANDSPLRFRMTPVDNGLDPAQQRLTERTDVFIQEERYLDAYARYFGKFIDAYQAKGIRISMVMPQNEFNSAQNFPSCLWSPSGLARFIRHLGPEMEKRGVEVYLGTIERADPALADSILRDPEAGRYVKGCGFQWAGKDALPVLHERYPEMVMMQTEQECGNGLNNWEGAMHSWELMKHYFTHGVSVYDYWNISLLEGGVSRWGWSQNSLVTVDAEARQHRFTPEAYLLKHASHYVQRGARLLKASGNYTDRLAFLNPDGRIVLLVANQQAHAYPVTLQVGDWQTTITLSPGSIRTVVIGG